MFDQIKSLLEVKENEVLSLQAGDCCLDLVVQSTASSFEFKLQRIQPKLNEYGDSQEDSQRIMHNHNAIIHKLETLRSELVRDLEGVENHLELKQLLDTALKDVNEKLNNKKSILAIKLQSDMNAINSAASLPESLSSPRGSHGLGLSAQILQSPRDKNQKFGLPCSLEVEVRADTESEVYWYLHHNVVATITPTATTSTNKNITTTKTRSNNNIYLYKLNIANFGQENTGLYTVVVRNNGGEASCRCMLDHISNHSTPRTNQSPMTNRSVSREEMYSEHNLPLALSSIPEDNFINTPRFIEALRQTDAWEGDAVVFKVHLAGNPEPEVRWFREGVEIQNSPDFKLSRDSRFRNVYFLEIPEIFLEDAGRFTCIAHNHLGSCQSTASLVVRTASEMASIPGLNSDQSLEDFGFSMTPISQSACSSVVNLSSNMITTQATPLNTTEECIKPYFKAVSRDLEICNGRVARFDSIVAGKPVPDVAWMKDDRPLMTCDKYAVVVNEKGVNSLIINTCDVADSGIYRCIASNKAGQEWFQVRLTVTVGMPNARYSPTDSMTTLYRSTPSKIVMRNVHSEERSSVKRFKGTRKNEIHSEERSAIRRNFYKASDLNKPHSSLRDNITRRRSPKKFLFSKTAVSNSTDVTSTGPPLLIEPIDDPDVNEGDTAVLTCRIFSPGKCYYQWFFNNEPLISDPKKYGIKAENDGYTLRIEDLSSADRGFYQCTVANEDGEVTCIGRVNPIGSLISRPESEIRICKSPSPFNIPSYWSRTIKEVKLSCTVTGRPKPKLTWYIGDEIILSNCEDFETSYDRQSGSVELKIKNVYKYLNRKIKCVAENEQGVTETECILTESMLADPMLTHPDYSNLLIHQISSHHNLPSFNTAPRFSHRVKSRTVKEGDTVTLTAVVHGRPQPIVKWLKDGETEVVPSKKHVLIFNEKSNVCQLKIFNCQSQDSGTYSCVAYNPNGQTTCSTSIIISTPESSSLTFDFDTGNPVSENLPQFTVDLEPSYKIIPGQPVKFSCRIRKEPSIEVTWYFNGIEVSSGHVMNVIDGDVISTLSIPHPKPANRGEYSCFVRNVYGETKTTTYLEIEETTTSVQFHTRQKPQEEDLKFSMPILQTHSIALPPNESINRFYNQPPSFNLPLVNHIATEGSEAFFVVKFTGEPPPSIQWFVNGNLISEKNSSYKSTTDFLRKESILYLKEVYVGDDGEYTCKAENISGMAYTTSHLYVKTLPRYTIRQERHINDSTQSLDHPEDGKPKFNVELMLVRPEKDKDDKRRIDTFYNKEFQIYDERETRRVEMEQEFVLQPEQAFSETISIDKTDQQVVQVDAQKPRRISELHIQRRSIVSSISEMDIELMKSIDLIPQKPLKAQSPNEMITMEDTVDRRLTIESEYELQPEPTFSETVSIDKSEVQEVVFDCPPSKKTSEISVKQEASLVGIKMEAEIILLKEPQNFTETVSIDKTRDHEVEFTFQKPHQTTELTVHQESMPKGSKIEAEILPEKKLTTELVVETGRAPKFLIELVPVNIMDGSPVYFTTKVFASPMPEYVTWYRNEKNCQEIVHISVDYDIDTGVSNLHIAEVFPEDSGRYMCVATNPFGTAKSTAVLTVSAYQYLEEESESQSDTLSTTSIDMKMSEKALEKYISKVSVMSEPVRMNEYHITPIVERFPEETLLGASGEYTSAQASTTLTESILVNQSSKILNKTFAPVVKVKDDFMDTVQTLEIVMKPEEIQHQEVTVDIGRGTSKKEKVLVNITQEFHSEGEEDELFVEAREHLDNVAIVTSVVCARKPWQTSQFNNAAAQKIQMNLENASYYTPENAELSCANMVVTQNSMSNASKQPATLLHGASQQLQLNLDRVEELKTSINSKNLPSHQITNDFKMSDVTLPKPTFIRGSLDHTKHQEIYGINVDLNFKHTYPDLITANFNKSVDKLKLVNHSSSIIDANKTEVVHMMQRPFIKSILTIPEQIAIRLLRLESIDTTLYSSSLLDYIMLLEQEFSFKAINLDNQTTVIPYADIVKVETGLASKEDKTTTRLLTNVYFLQLEETQNVDFSFVTCKNENKSEAYEEMSLADKNKLLSHCLSQLKSVTPEYVATDALCQQPVPTYKAPMETKTILKQSVQNEKVLTRVSVSEYIMLLQQILALKTLNIENSAINLQMPDLVLLETVLVAHKDQLLTRVQPNLFYLQLEQIKDLKTIIKNSDANISHVDSEMMHVEDKGISASHSAVIVDHKNKEEISESNVSAMREQQIPEIIKRNFNNNAQINKVLSRVSVSEYKLLIEKLMALDTLNIENSSINLQMPDLVLLQTFYASCKDKPLSRVQPNLLYMHLTEVSKREASVEKESVNSSETKVGLDVQSSMTKVKEYFIEPKEEIEEKEEQPIVNKPRERQPKDEETMFEELEVSLKKMIDIENKVVKEEDEYTDMFESWESCQKIEIESDNESDISTESMYEEWEFTTIKQRVVEEEFPMKRNVVEVRYPESKETTVVLKRKQDSETMRSDHTDFRTQTSLDRSLFSTDMFNRIVRTDVDKSYTRPTFENEITSTELIKNHSVILTTNVSAIPEPEIEWYKDGVRINNSRNYSTYHGDGSYKLTINKFTSRYAGRYACRAINEVGMNEAHIVLDYDFFEADGEEVDKTYDHLTFEESFMEIREEWMKVTTEETEYKSLKIPTAPAFEQEISSITVVDGNDVTLFCKLISYPEARIEWYFRNTLIKQSHDFKMGYKNDYCYLMIREAMPHDQGEYTIKASNQHGSSSTFIYLTVMDSYELRESMEVQTRSSKTQKSYRAASKKNYMTAMKSEKFDQSAQSSSQSSSSKRTELSTKSSKKTTRFADLDEELYSSGEESIEMWTVEEWLFYDYNKYYNAEVFMKKRDDYLEYYKYIPYDEKSFRERISSTKAALSDPHAFRFPVIIKELPIVEVFEGKRVVMECVVEARPVPQITWFKNGKKIESSEHISLSFEKSVSSLTIEQTLLNDEAEYKCEARNEFGSSFTWGQLYVETVQLRWGRIKNFRIVRKKCLL